MAEVDTGLEQLLEGHGGPVVMTGAAAGAGAGVGVAIGTVTVVDKSCLLGRSAPAPSRAPGLAGPRGKRGLEMNGGLNAC